MTREELHDEIAEVIWDGMDIDWSSTDGARSVMTIPSIAALPALIEALEQIKAIATGSTTANSLPHLAKIAGDALALTKSRGAA